MAGHSKWSNIKRKKGANDAERGKIFTKIAKEMQVAVRLGGPDPDGNFRLKLCIQKAKANNMPADNIKRCIEKAAGLGEGGTAIEEFTYEGYGVGGVAVLCDMMTDNRNRTASEIRYIFSRNDGNLGETGCVSYMFERMGEIVVDLANKSSDALIEAALDAGAEDVEEDESNATVYTATNDLESVRTALIDAGFEIIEAGIIMKPSNTILIEDLETAQKLMKLLEALEDNDDVREVYANYDFSDAIIAELQ
jgi:YebC/PmpR family DNA-binding regulatory protein